LPTKPETPLLEVRSLDVHFSLHGSFANRLRGRTGNVVRAVDGVSFAVAKGEVLGLVGESGSGKSTLARAILGLVTPTAGVVRFDGMEISSLPETRFRPLRRRMQLVFQDAHASLNPTMSVFEAVADALRIHGIAGTRQQERERVAEALDRVGLTPFERFAEKRPSELSGGQKQRVVLARAIALGPDLLLADEPVSMLDMSVRSKILSLMVDLKRDLDFTYVYITHDLATARFFCDRIAIMYLGRIVEIGPAEAIYDDPRHPYTQSLLSALPDINATGRRAREVPRGEVPDAAARPLGCAFHPRCPRAFEVCGWESRDLRRVFEERWTALSVPLYEEERRVLGSVDELTAAATMVRLRPGRGHSSNELLALLERVRRELPGEPFFRGVRQMCAVAGAVEIAFHTPLDPHLTPSHEVDVACHLYDDVALAEAARDREELA
jgi:peptide/nickel transport system ATP-binding protein